MKSRDGRSVPATASDGQVALAVPDRSQALTADGTRQCPRFRGHKPHRQCHPGRHSVVSEVQSAPYPQWSVPVVFTRCSRSYHTNDTPESDYRHVLSRRARMSARMVSRSPDRQQHSPGPQQSPSGRMVNSIEAADFVCRGSRIVNFEQSNEAAPFSGTSSCGGTAMI